MAAHFFDSSGLVKGYVNETGSAWVAGILNPAAGNVIHVARITAVEVVSAIARRQRQGSLSAAAAAGMLADFRHDLATAFHVVEITPALVVHAMSLAEVHALRGYDAVQLAAALYVHAQQASPQPTFTLVSADAELNAAAAAEGLAVDDPNLHP